MNFYKEQIVPLLINMAMRQRNLAAYRTRVVPAAEDRVIEIGIGSGLNLPFYSHNVEHIIGLDPSPKFLLMAWTLCSISDVERALAEIRRVLKPGGRLLFVEHGRAPEPKVRWWQDQLTPVWKRLSGGCHLNRAMNVLIEGAGFQLERVETGYLRGPKPMTFMYEGSARPL